jgi:hypothetical protein
MTTLGITLSINIISVFSVETKRFLSRTDSASSSVQVQVSVFRRVLMTMRTMGLKRLVFTSFSASRVLSVKNWFKMSRVAAKRVTAKMIDFFALLDWTYKHLISNSMSRFGFSSNGKMSVFDSVFATRAAEPNPAFAFGIAINIFPNTVRQVSNSHDNLNTKLEVVV